MDEVTRFMSFFIIGTVCTVVLIGCSLDLVYAIRSEKYDNSNSI